jgi:hypothetical protein
MDLDNRGLIQTECTMEKNTYATSIFIDAPLADVAAYVGNGMNLNEYTLYSRMQKRIDENTWLGTASGYQAGLYYHVRHRELGYIQIVEWHCGAEHGKYFHVYPMLLFRPDYFDVNAGEKGTYYHWISFVDPARRTTMITEGLPTVHRAECHSLKAQLERRAGLRRPAAASLRLDSHTIYVEAPMSSASAYLADEANATEWGYLLRRDGTRLYDEYDHPVEIKIKTHDLGQYQLIEHDTHYTETATIVRTPIVLIPSSYAFAQPDAPGVIMHRVTAWPLTGEREHGKSSEDDYNAEAINAKRIIEAKAGNLDAFGRGCSYLAPKER